MEDDLKAIVLIPEEIEGGYGRSFAGEEWRFAVDKETREDIFPFNFDIALSVVEGSEVSMEEKIYDAISEVSGEKSFPCNSYEKICKSKGGLTRHINTKHKNKLYRGIRTWLHQHLNLQKKSYCQLWKITGKITKDVFWDDETTANMVRIITSSNSLYNPIQPIYRNDFGMRPHLPGTDLRVKVTGHLLRLSAENRYRALNDCPIFIRSSPDASSSFLDS